MYISLSVFPKDFVYPFYFPKIYIKIPILKLLFQNIFKGYTSVYCSVADYM